MSRAKPLLSAPGSTRLRFLVPTMRSAINWFNQRRRLITYALFALVAVGVLSAGDTPQPDEWVRIPDLGVLVIVAIGVMAVVGLVLITLSPTNVEVRRDGEIRSIKALLILVALVAAVTLWFEGRELLTEPVADEQEQTSTPGSDALDANAGEGALGATGTDLLGLALILLLVMVVVFRGSRRSRVVEVAPQQVAASEAELAQAVIRAHRHLRDTTDPRMAVMVAYSDLEDELARLGLPRIPTETAVEHMARVLADVPDLAAPAMRLGELYEIARFSNMVVTESDRQRAAEALAGAQRSLVNEDSVR